MSNKPIIWNYHNYREFLKDWLAYLKASQSAYSLRMIAKKTKISPSSITMVLKGQRTLTNNLLQKLTPYLNLNSQELSYLKLLIIVTDAKDPDKRLEALKKLQRFNDYRELHRQELETYKYLTKWFYVVIREMVNLDDFKNDPHWIREKLNKKLRSHEVSEALRFLEENGFIEVSNSKTIKADKLVQCIDGIYKLSLSDFHKQMLSMAANAIDKVSSENRLILGHTVALSPSQYNFAKEVLQEAINKLESLMPIPKNTEKKTDVYHFGLLSFPVTEINPKIEEKHED
ncbi:MAG: TIGR02147 family protein [Bdellovibrionales bacterium]|nr:TIGR02147 family protein [Bdellovibrionales bacterium]